MRFYRRRTICYSKAHYRSAQIIEERNRVLTVVLIFSSILTVMLTSAHWATAITSLFLLVPRDLFGVLTVALASVQFALNLSEKASQHKLAGTEYSSVRREIELLVDRLEAGGSVSERDWKHVGNHLGLVTKLSPMVSQRVWKSEVEQPLNKLREKDGRPLA